MCLKHRLLSCNRIAILKSLLRERINLKVMEAHDGLSAIIASTAQVASTAWVASGVDQDTIQFDALWVSSLTDSAAKGHPDIGVIDYSSRLQTISEILQVTNKPLIVDGDTGGDENQFEYFCNKLETLGVSAVIIEDKQFPKRNSLEKESIHILEDPIRFANKINRAKEIGLSNDFMIFARIESFIAGEDLNEAIKRARIYLCSKADGIMIHSNQKTPDQIYRFAKAYRALCQQYDCYKPLICIPTSYNAVYESDLFSQGFNIVIYANHLLRAAHKAMKNVSHTILTHGRSLEATPYLSSTNEILTDVGYSDVIEKDKRYNVERSLVD